MANWSALSLVKKYPWDLFPVFLDLFLGLRVSGVFWVLIPGLLELKTLFSITIAVAGFIPRTFFHIFFLLGPDSATFERIMFNLAKDALKIAFALNGTSVLEMPLGGAPLCALFEPHGPLERRFKLVTNVDTGDDERKFLRGAKCKACKKETTKTARFVWFGHLGGEQSDPGCGWAKCTEFETYSVDDRKTWRDEFLVGYANCSAR